MPRPNLYDILKVLALTCMVIDHVGYFFFPELFWLRRVGRIAFPIFLFLVWYNHSYKRRWSLRIWWGLVQLWLRRWLQQWVWTYGAYGWTVWLNILLAIAVTRVLLWWASRFSGWVAILFLLWVLFFNEGVWEVEYGTMSIIRWCVGYRVRSLHDNVWMGSLSKQVLARGCIGLWSIGQYLITYEYFGWSNGLIVSSVLVIWWVLWTIIYGNRPLWSEWKSKPILLWLSRRALPLYAIHIVILYLIKVLRF